jgi:hypothetical protein
MARFAEDLERTLNGELDEAVLEGEGEGEGEGVG